MKNDFNSIKNQDIKSKFVGREVYTNVNQMVDYILNKSNEDDNAPFSWDDVENLYAYPEWSSTVIGEDLYFGGGSEDDKSEFLENFDRLIEESERLLNDGKISDATHERNVQLIEDARKEVEDLEQEQAEIFEWWAVSGWLCEKLAEKGACVIKDHNLWGRTTTGQAILLDHVISQICEDMKILEGQENEWKG